LGFFPQNMLHLQNERKRGTVAAPADAASAFCSFHSLITHPREVSLFAANFLHQPSPSLPLSRTPRLLRLALPLSRPSAAVLWPRRRISSSPASAWSASFPAASSAARQGAAKHEVDPLLGGALHTTTSGARVGSNAARLD
jgi:hypothetical protein